MRTDSSIFIYINVHKAIAGLYSSFDYFIYSDLFPNRCICYQTDGIEFYKSANNVILSTGRGGVLPPRFFLKVVDETGKVLYPAEPQSDRNSDAAVDQ